MFKLVELTKQKGLKIQHLGLSGVRWGGKSCLAGAYQMCTAFVRRAVNGFVSVTEEQSHKGLKEVFSRRVSLHAD